MSDLPYVLWNEEDPHDWLSSRVWKGADGRRRALRRQDLEELRDRWTQAAQGTAWTRNGRAACALFANDLDFLIRGGRVRDGE